MFRTYTALMKKYLLIILALLLFSCNLDQEKELTTEITSVGWILETRTAEYSAYYSSLRLRMYVYLDDIPLTEIKSIDIEHTNTNLHWFYDGDKLDEHYNTEYNRLEAKMVSGNDDDTMYIGDYEITIELKNGFKTDMIKNIPAPGESQDTAYSIVINEDYSGSSTSHAIMPKRPTITSFTKNGDELNITFNVEDDIIYSGYLYFYDSNNNTVGRTDYLRDYETSDISSFLNNGDEFYIDGSDNTILLTTQDISFYSGYDFSDIDKTVFALTDGKQYEGTSSKYDSIAFAQAEL